PATPSMRAEQFTHPVLGNLTATADQRGVYPGWVRVQDETSGAPFVVRRPNPEGTGGVKYANDSNNADAASSSGRTPSTTEQISSVLNVPRAIENSFNTHSLFRQAAISFGSHPIQTMKAYFQSLPSLWSEESAGRMLNEIQTSPFAPLAKESGLYLADYTSKPQPLSAREENFMSNLVGKIPGVRGSQRQFTTFLDKIRMDSFSEYAKANPDASPETLQGVARFINLSTGRGDLGAWGERHALGLSNIFYSPRFAVSRAQLLTTPFRGTPEARAFAAKELTRYVATNLGIMALAKAGGLDIGINPLSSDFGSLKVGNTRVSLWGSMDKTARYVAQFMMGASASASTGQTRDRSRLDTALTFLRSKAAPQLNYALDLSTGKDFAGRDVTPGEATKNLFMPFTFRDVEEAVRDDVKEGGSGIKGAAAGGMGFFGASVQTVPQKSDAEQVNQMVEWLKTQPESKYLTGSEIRHNARVQIALHPLFTTIKESGLPEAEQERLKQFVNSRFYYARARAGDRRDLRSVERVFDERIKDAEQVLNEKIARRKAVVGN
nr:hypothetical protein [Acidobacteriota bacterium]